MGEFNSDDHYIYYCGQESLRKNGVAIMVNKRVRNVKCFSILIICIWNTSQMREDTLPFDLELER